MAKSSSKVSKPKSIFLLLAIVSFALLVLVIIAQALAVQEILEYPKFTEEELDFIHTDKLLLAERLRQALRIRTISQKGDDFDKKPFIEMHQLLKKLYPTVHSSPHVKMEVVNGYSLLYTIQGSKAHLKPYLLMAHMDVVPGLEEDKWQEPPFAGNIVNETYIYGRGAMDDKASLMGIMEGLEYYLHSGRRPVRSFYISFGHDEEVQGGQGSGAVAKKLRERGVKELDFILDEGTAITTGLFHQYSGRVAMIGVAHKGLLDVELSVQWTPGHASVPPKQTAIGILSRAVARLSTNQQPSMFGRGTEAATFEYLAPYTSFLSKIFLANLWLFGGLVAHVMCYTPTGNSLIRTSTAVTIVESGIKNNVIPATGRAILHHRIHPAQKLQEVLEEDARIVDDSRVNMRVVEHIPASYISPYGPRIPEFMTVASSIHQVYPDAVIVPGMLHAITDTRWFADFTSNIYLFFPHDIVPSDYARMHGYDERVTVDNYYRIVNFYYRFIRNAELLAENFDKRTAFRNVEL